MMDDVPQPKTPFSKTTSIRLNAQELMLVREAAAGRNMSIGRFIKYAALYVAEHSDRQTILFDAWSKRQ